jgi:hypothetical protein
MRGDGMRQELIEAFGRQVAEAWNTLKKLEAADTGERGRIADLLALLTEQHAAMADVMELRRLSTDQRQRDKAEAAIAVWHKVGEHLGAFRGGAATEGSKP